MNALKKVGLFLVSLLAPVLAQTTGTVTSAADTLLRIIAFVFGPIGETPSTASTSLVQVIFLWVLPAILVYAIMFDFIYLMGFFRRKTAQIIAVIFALFGAKFGVYIRVVELIQNFVGGTGNTGILIPMLTLVFVLMLIWWALGQILWGFNFATAAGRETTTVKGAMDFLDTVGKRLEEKGKDKP